MHAITWFEIPAKNFDRAVDFYSAILDKPLRKGDFMGVPHGFFQAENDTAVSGAVVSNPNYESSDQGVLIYLNAWNELDAVLSRVQTAGGTVLTPKTAIGPQGFFAILKDTEGNKIGLHQPA